MQLDHLLYSATVPPPYVLVTSSISSWIADQYAARWPRDIAGMVIIDPTNLTPWSGPAPTQHVREDDNEPDGYLRFACTSSFAELARVMPPGDAAPSSCVLRRPMGTAPAADTEPVVRAPHPRRGRPALAGLPA
jgi:pimeloyl-ACP methyl ester carboxylesterase